MNCQFCSNEMSKGPTVQANNIYCQDFRCLTCHCYFTYEKTKKTLIKYVMYVDKYRLDCNLSQSSFHLGIFDADSMARYEDVYIANVVPNLTPQNALTKIKTILVFL